MRVAILGASGLVGSTLAVYLTQQRQIDVVPMIRSAGNAWRLARRGMPLKTVDILSPSEIEAAITDCTHVVNCTRGDDDVMLKGLKNVLRASVSLGVEKFIHLSSVMVYGDPPPPTSVTEVEPTLSQKEGYGWIKLRQDRMVQDAARSGLPSVILCPPNIIGPYSYFLLQIRQAIVQQEFALLDDGASPCCTVDALNLAHAIDRALHGSIRDGRRYFVTDDEAVSWGELVTRLEPVMGGAKGPRSIQRDEIESAMVDDGKTKVSVVRSLVHLVSSDVREALRKDPLWEKLDVAIRRGVASSGTAIEERLRQTIEGPAVVRPFTPDSPDLNVRLVAQQLRGVQHSCGKIKDELDYRPIVTFEGSMRAFGRWYRASTGRDTEAWDLLRHLN